MAHTIKLKFGSPSSYSYIDLTDSSHGNIDYYPRTAGADADDITESGAFRVAGSSVADLIAKINEIESVFYKARAYDLDKIGAYQVFVTMQPDGVAETWESQVYEGRLELTDNVFGGDWANRHTDVVLIWRRAPYWERYVSIPISNSNGSGSSTKVYNFGDGAGTAPNKNENWVDIAAGVVGGDLPAPAVVSFTGIYGDGINTILGRILISNNARAAPTIKGVYEFETLTHYTPQYGRSGGRTYNDTVGYFDFFENNATLGAVRDGAWLRFGFTANILGGMYVTPYIKYSGGVINGKTLRVFYYSDPSNPYFYHDLGMVRLPSADEAGASFLADGFDTMRVGINIAPIDASPAYFMLDYFTCVPTDYYVIAENGSFGKAAVIDTRHKKSFGNNLYPGGNTIYTTGIMSGGLYLEPALAQRLTFKLFYGLATDNIASATVAVNAYLRKRTV